MVNENTEPVQSELPVDEGVAEATVDVNPIISEVDQLNGVPDEAPAPDVQAPPPTEAESILSAPQPPVDPQPPIPPTQQMAPEQIQQLQADQAQYQQVQLRAQLQQDAQRYQQQLESQGYLPDQAQQIAHQFMQSRSAQVDMMRQNEYNTQTLMGKQAAAEHFAKTYNLSFDDLATLKIANDPQQMEQVAKKISSDRKRDDELSKLRQAQVPPQQFDNSQGAPEVASSDNAWLDRYIYNNDRSPNAVEAARRAAQGQ